MLFLKAAGKIELVAKAKKGTDAGEGHIGADQQVLGAVHHQSVNIFPDGNAHIGLEFVGQRRGGEGEVRRNFSNRASEGQMLRNIRQCRYDGRGIRCLFYIDVML